MNLDPRTSDPTLPVAGVEATLAAPVTGDAPTAAGSVVPRSRAAAPPLDDDDAFAAVDPRRYQVSAELARGGMGRILVARDRRLGRKVAIKELLVASPELRLRFEREARITATLQHPAIVNLLEAGAWPGGEPFYVMKLVAGESLDKAIAARPTLAARLALLPNVIAAVDALAYAHSMRVIHRDLKPANVLVGDFGETVVLDWGLAKDLADQTADSVPAIGARELLGGETVVGSVLGTPAYMPMEQAEGESVDERADVYALGAMLYHVLAGVPPYTGKTLEVILDAVVAGPPPSLVDVVPGVPRDLVAIVEKAMAHRAADRYPTAKELVDDLKSFQTGQLVGAHRYTPWQLVLRWVRRNRAAVSVAALAVVALAIGGVVSVRRIVNEQGQTERQRAAAVEQRGEAEGLMRFMLIDLRDKLQSRVQLALLDDAVQKALAYYERRGPADNDLDRSNRAVLVVNAADVLGAKGDLAGALEQYRNAQRMFEQLATTQPANIGITRSLAILHMSIGDTISTRGDTAKALDEYRTALALAERVVAANQPGTMGYQAREDRALCRDRIGAALNLQGANAAALEQYRTALREAEQLAHDDPDPQWKALVGSSHRSLGTALYDQDLAAATASFRTALAIFTEMARNDPANGKWQQQLVGLHQELGDALLDTEDVPGATIEFRAALAIAQTAATADPSDLDRLHEVAMSRSKLGDAFLDAGERDAALGEYRAALAIAESIAARSPGNVVYRELVDDLAEQMRTCCEH